MRLPTGTINLKAQVRKPYPIPNRYTKDQKQKNIENKA
jgi:hypothetical protein